MLYRPSKSKNQEPASMFPLASCWLPRLCLPPLLILFFLDGTLIHIGLEFEIQNILSMMHENHSLATVSASAETWVVVVGDAFHMISFRTLYPISVIPCLDTPFSTIILDVNKLPSPSSVFLVRGLTPTYLFINKMNKWLNSCQI